MPAAKFDIKGCYEVAASGCWLWTMATNASGYGAVKRYNQHWLAHRFSWHLANGPIPDGMTVDHLCYERSCVNPDHLRLLTHDANAKNQRFASPLSCRRGHRLTPDNVNWNLKVDGTRYRRCLTCVRESWRRKAERRKAERSAA